MYAGGDDDAACFKGIFEALSALLKIGILLCSLPLPLADEVKLQAPKPSTLARIRTLSLSHFGGSKIFTAKGRLDSYASTTTWM